MNTLPFPRYAFHLPHLFTFSGLLLPPYHFHFNPLMCIKFLFRILDSLSFTSPPSLLPPSLPSSLPSFLPPSLPSSLPSFLPSSLPSYLPSILLSFILPPFLSAVFPSFLPSLHFRAPEVIIGHPYDGRIDIWSVGCVLAEMHTVCSTYLLDHSANLFIT